MVAYLFNRTGAVRPTAPHHPTTPLAVAKAWEDVTFEYATCFTVTECTLSLPHACGRCAAGVQRVADNVPGVRCCMDGDGAELVMRRLSSHGTNSAVCRADQPRGKEAPFDRAPQSPSSVTERRIQTHSGGAADEAGFEVVGDVSALAPTALHPSPSLSLLALPAELLTLVAEQLDAHCD